MKRRMQIYGLIIIAAVVVVSVALYFLVRDGRKEKNTSKGLIESEEMMPEIVLSGEEQDSQGNLQEQELSPEQEAKESEPAPSLLKEGVEHASVAELQARLMELGFMENDEPTQYYGAVTANAVKVFQRQNGLEQDGITGTETFSAIMQPDAKHYAVALGVSGSDVKRIQNRLYELGYLPTSDTVNGTFDEQTEKAVIKLQEMNQLIADGKVGSQTLNLLYSEDIKPNYLSYGEKNEVVLASQKRLKELGYLTTSPDGNYGTDTVHAVKQFQSRNDLVVDGYLGPTTRVALGGNGARPNGLVLGDHGDSVKRVQELLGGYGYLVAANATGYYGEITEEAVKTFQKNNKLSVDGSVGIRTMEKLTGNQVVKKSGSGKTASGTGGSNGGSSGGNAGETIGGSVQALIDVAVSKVGSKYVWGSKGPDTFDCSGFIYWCLNKIGVRQSYLTSSGWRTIGKYKKISNYDEIRPGDIIVENGHMGIAAEGGKVVDASSGNGRVMYRARSKWWRDNFIVAWRIFD